MNPHLFIATDPWGDTSLWFGTGPDDRHCELVEFGGRSGVSDVVHTALWEALVASPLVEDESAEVSA